MRSSLGTYCYILFILLNVTVAEVFGIFTDTDTRIKGVQIGHHEIKKYIFQMTPHFS